MSYITYITYILHISSNIYIYIYIYHIICITIIHISIRMASTLPPCYAWRLYSPVAVAIDDAHALPEESHVSGSSAGHGEPTGNPWGMCRRKTVERQN